jgi:hypothetical protein
MSDRLLDEPLAYPPLVLAEGARRLASELRPEQPDEPGDAPPNRALLVERQRVAMWMVNPPDAVLLRGARVVGRYAVLFGGHRRILGQRRAVFQSHGTDETQLLHEPLAHSPLVLAKQHASKLHETGGRIVERAEDALPVVDRQCDDGDLPVQRVPEQAGRRFVDKVCKLADELGSDEKPSEHHRGQAT